MADQACTGFFPVLCVFIPFSFSLGGSELLQRQFTMQENSRLAGSTFTERSAVGSALRCSALCSKHSHCISFNYAKDLRLCELNRNTSRSDPKNLETDGRFKYYEIMNIANESKLTEGMSSKEQLPTSGESTSEKSTTQTASSKEQATTAPTTWEPPTEKTTTSTPTPPTTTRKPTTMAPTTQEQTTRDPTTSVPTTQEQTTRATTSQEPTTDSASPTTISSTQQPTSVAPTTQKPTTTGSAKREPTTLTHTTSDLMHQSCSALKQAGHTTDGHYMIDPDGGHNGEEPFEVYCSEMTTTGWTNVDHPNAGHAIRVTSDPFDITIAYNANTDQIQALVDISSGCRQRLIAECRNAHLWIGETQLGWWVANDGTRMRNWAGAAFGIKGCSCFGSCAGSDPTSRCNCGAYANHWHTDGGFIVDKAWLPVKALHFDSAAPPNELYYNLGRLQCATAPTG